MTTAAPCTCRKDIEQKLTERFISLAPEATDHKVTLSGYALILGSALESKAYMPMELTATFPLKKGGTKSKVQKQNMVFSFCPFCGQKYGAPA